MSRRVPDVPPISCACGCGTIIPAYNKMGYLASYAHGHNRKGDTGYKHTPEALAKITAINRARGLAQRGENHPNWKGGITLGSRFHDPRYKVWHMAVLQRDNYICQHCGRVFKPRARKIAAHHIRGYTAFPEDRYDITNGICLCWECHATVHGKRYKETPLPLCACGCGEQVRGYKKDGTPATWILGHNALKGRKASLEAREAMAASHRGKTYSDAFRHAQQVRRERERQARNSGVDEPRMDDHGRTLK